MNGKATETLFLLLVVFWLRILSKADKIISWFSGPQQAGNERKQDNREAVARNERLRYEAGMWDAFASGKSAVSLWDRYIF